MANVMREWIPASKSQVCSDQEQTGNQLIPGWFIWNSEHWIFEM